jgi:hypothetical protein
MVWVGVFLIVFFFFPLFSSLLSSRGQRKEKGGSKERGENG